MIVTIGALQFECPPNFNDRTEYRFEAKDPDERLTVSSEKWTKATPNPKAAVLSRKREFVESVPDVVIEEEKSRQVGRYDGYELRLKFGKDECSRFQLIVIDLDGKSYLDIAHLTSCQ